MRCSLSRGSSLLAILLAAIAALWGVSVQGAGVADWSFLNSASNDTDWSYGRTYAFSDAGVVLGATPPPGSDHGAWVGMMRTNPTGLTFVGTGVEIQYYAPDALTPPTEGYELMTMLHEDDTSKDGFSVARADPYGALRGDGVTKQFRPGGPVDYRWSSTPANGLVGAHTLAMVSIGDGVCQTYLDGTLVNTFTGAAIDNSIPVGWIGIGDNSVNGNWYWPFGSVISRVRTFTVASGLPADVNPNLLPVATWNGPAGSGGGGNWADANWTMTGSASGSTWSDGADAFFGKGTDTGGTVAIAGTVKPHSISFNNTSNNSPYALTGGTIDFNGATGLITVADGMSAEIQSSIANGGLAKSGGGGLTLSATCTYANGTSIVGGTLLLGSAGNINASSGIVVNGEGAKFASNSAAAVTAPITITKGTIGGTGTISAVGGVSIGAGAVVAPGSAAPGGQAYTTGLTFAEGGTYQWKINDAAGTPGTASDLLSVTGFGLTATTDVKFRIDVNALTAGNVPGVLPNFNRANSHNWKILDASSEITDFDAAKFNLIAATFAANNWVDAGRLAIARGDTVSGGTNQQLWLTYTGGLVDAPLLYWKGGTGTSWGTAANWGQSTLPAATDTPIFGHPLADPSGAVDLGSDDRTAYGITFMSGVNTTIASTEGKTLTMTGDGGGNAVVEVQGGAHEISANIAGGNITKTGPGTLILSGVNSYGTHGGNETIVSGGMLLATKFSSLPDVNSDLVWTNPGATLAVRALEASTNGEWTSANLDTLLGGGGATAAFEVSSKLGIEVTAGNTFEYANDIAGTSYYGEGGTGKGLVKLGAGTLVLSAAGTYTGGTTIAGGTLQLNVADALREGSNLVLTGSAKVALGGSSTVNLGNAVKIGDLNINGHATTGLTATLDLNKSKIILDKTYLSVAATRAQIKSAYQGGYWTGSGITSSTAAAQRVISGPTAKNGVGYLDNAILASQGGSKTTWQGRSVNSNSILVRYTYYGDANLDGAVNLADFGLLKANYGTGSHWYQGDFDYSGTVNLADFGKLKAAYGSTPITADAVPEPSVIALLLTGGLALAARIPRRRK